MAKVKKIFPAQVGNTVKNSFKIFFVAEGYLKTEYGLFLSDCIETIHRILKTPPFNLLRIRPNFLSVYAIFKDSTNSGPAIDTTPSNNRSVLESKLNSSNGILEINYTKLEDILKTIKIPYLDESINFTDIAKKGVPNMGILGDLIVVLLPELATSNAKGGEYENPLDKDQYYFVATTKNKEWYQIILHGLGKTLGLNVEYELDGNDFEEPPTDVPISFNKNLTSFENMTADLANAKTNWSSLFSATQRVQAISIHPNNSSSGIPSTNINIIPETPEKIEFWEGGGGYRKKVYRSAKDCLMRRQIGNTSLPVREQKMPLCFVCRNIIKNLIY